MTVFIHHLRFALRPFLRNLELAVLVLSLLWALLIMTTILLLVLPEISANYAQNWWLIGCMLFGALTAGLVAQTTSQLIRSDAANVIPGWRKGHVALMLLSCILLVLLPFMASGLLAWVNNETWDLSSFAWLTVSVCAATLFSIFVRSKNSPLLAACNVLYLILGVGFLVVNPSFGVLAAMRSAPWVLWVVAALLCALLGFALGRISAPKAGGAPNQSWQAFAWVDHFVSRIRGKSFSRSANPLLNRVFRAPDLYLNGALVLFYAAVSWRLPMPKFASINSSYYLSGYTFVLVGLLLFSKLPQSANTLMCLPGGLSRPTLGFALFKLKLKLGLWYCFGFTVFFAVLDQINPSTPRFLVYAEQVALAFGATVFATGFSVAAYRSWFKDFSNPTISSIASATSLAFVFMTSVFVAKDYRLSSAVQLSIAAALAVIGWILGRYYSSHLGRMEFEQLLHPRQMPTWRRMFRSY